MANSNNSTSNNAATVNLNPGTTKGVSKNLIEKISSDKSEPKWMLDYRLKSFEIFKKSQLPYWVDKNSLKNLNIDELNYYITPAERVAKSWDDVPEDIRSRFDKLGIPDGEKDFLAGTGAQYESQMVYHAVRDELAEKGVIFEDMSTAVKEYSELVKEYFGKLVNPQNNKFAALNGAVWSGGSFIYIPEGVKLSMPLHNFFQMNLASQGQFERTIIVADEGSSLEFIEGCIAPLYSVASLHAGVVEIFAQKNSKIKFSTLQNWSKNIYNLVTKKAVVHEDAEIEWIDGNVGSGVTMKYPSLLLSGRGAKGRIRSLSFAGKGQRIDAGGKAIHLAPDTAVDIESKSILRKGGEAIYRGQVYISEKADRVSTSVDCVSLMLEDGGVSKAIPDIKVKNSTSKVDHESSLLKITKNQLDYLMVRGLDQSLARGMIVGGFVEPFTTYLPMEYAVEFNRLIDLELKDEK